MAALLKLYLVVYYSHRSLLDGVEITNTMP
jgi:hypothetical protein